MSRSAPYERAADELLRESGCVVRRWRSSTTGVAFTREEDWGIEAPEPRGPVSFATFAHEIAHQVLHRRNSAPRWLEEIEAWEYALAQFERFELRGVERARADAVKCLLYAARKASRRCSPETARRILDRYGWVWRDAPVDRAGVLLDLSART